jgi:hypothetical protein
MKTHFVITRRTHWWMNWLPLTVYVDDIEIGPLYNNEYLEYTLVQHEQYVRVAIASWGFFRKKIDLHIKPTDRFDINIVSSWNDVIKALAFITALLILYFAFYHSAEKVRLMLSGAVLMYQLIGYGAATFIDTHYDRTLLIPQTSKKLSIPGV